MAPSLAIEPLGLNRLEDNLALIKNNQNRKDHKDRKNLSWFAFVLFASFVVNHLVHDRAGPGWLRGPPW
jgi:hypothetical protein